MEVWGFVFWWMLALIVTTLVGSEIVKRRRDLGWGVFTAMMSTYLVINMLLVPRVIEVPGLTGFAASLGLSAAVVSGTVFWPFIGQMVDMTNEVYGRNKAYLAAGISFVGRIIVIMFILMAAQASPLFTDRWTTETEGFWQSYFAISGPRIFFAGLLSYGLQQLANIYVFARMKRATAAKETTRGKRVLYGWFRNQASDLAETVIDSPTFYVVAFAGVLPWDLIVTITLSAMLVKGIIALVITEPFYAWFRFRTFEVQREF